MVAVDPDMVELAVEGFTKAMETDIGDQCVHFVANAKGRDSKDNRRDSRVDRTGRSRDSRSSQESTHQSEREADRRPREEHHHSERRKNKPEWSWKSYWQSKRHPQRPASDEPRVRPNETHPVEKSRKSYWQNGRHQRQQQQIAASPPRIARYHHQQKPSAKDCPSYDGAWEQRCDQFRLAKNAYVPTVTPTVTELKWVEERVYEDVGRAVQEAIRRSGEMDRRRPR